VIVRVIRGPNGGLELVPRNGDARALRAELSDVRDLRVTGSRVVATTPEAAGRLLLSSELRSGWDWEPSAIVAVKNRIAARAVQPSLVALRDELRAGNARVARSTLPATRLIASLDDHQALDVALMTATDGYGACIFDEQGTGKTVTVIAAFDVMASRGIARQLIIVAPKSMLAEWERDFGRFTGDRYAVVVLSAPGRPPVGWHDADVIVANFEYAVSHEEELIAVARRAAERSILTVDESFYAKNPDARRSQALGRLREWCGRAFVLCGTPAPNSPKDVMHQFDLVDFGITFGGLRLPDELDAQRQVVADAMEQRGVYMRSLKADVLPTLPGKTFTKVLVEFSPQQRRAYERVLEGLVDDVRSIDDAAFRKDITSFMARRSALLQLCSHPGAIVDPYDEVPGKLLALDAILEDAVDRRGEKVVLWSYFRRSLDEICKRYERYGLVRFDGSTPTPGERRAAIAAFQESPDVRLFVGNPAAAGAGITLHAARLAIYESLSNQAAHFLQSVDRIHRRGQVREVQLIVLLCRDSLEPAMFERLESKTVAQRDLLGDNDLVPMTREAFLHELVGAS
jgi:SNF2 family DNA or RNA helicase